MQGYFISCWKRWYLSSCRTPISLSAPKIGMKWGTCRVLRSRYGSAWSGSYLCSDIGETNLPKHCTAYNMPRSSMLSWPEIRVLRWLHTSLFWYLPHIATCQIPSPRHQIMGIYYVSAGGLAAWLPRIQHRTDFAWSALGFSQANWTWFFRATPCGRKAVSHLAADGLVSGKLAWSTSEN